MNKKRKKQIEKLQQMLHEKEPEEPENATLNKASPQKNSGQLQFVAKIAKVDENKGFVNILVERVDGSDDAVSVKYSTTPENAREEHDYIHTTGQLKWKGSDVLSKRITVPIVNDQQFERNETFTLALFEPSKNEARLNLWHTSWKIFLEHKLLGVGHANFDHYFEIYKVPGFYDAKGHAHNDYLNLLVLNGIIGLITWLGMWISWYYYSVRVFFKTQLLEADKTIVLSGILGVSGILIGSIFQCYYTDLENNIFWWFVAMMNLQIIVQYGNK